MPDVTGSGDAAKEVWIVCDESVLIHRQFGPEARSIEALEKKKAFRKACVRLRLGLHGQVWSRHPGHSKLLAYTDRDLAAPQGKAVRQRGGPDVDVDAAVKMMERLAMEVLPSALTVGPQAEG